MAGMIGWIAINDHHYPHKGQNKVGNTMTKTQEITGAKLDFLESPETYSMGVVGMTSKRTLNRIRAGVPRDRLVGI